LLPDEDNNLVRIKLVSALYCQLFASLVDLRFANAKAEFPALKPKIKKMKNAGCEFFCCLFRCTAREQCPELDLDRALTLSLEFVTTLVEIRFIEARANTGNWWELANHVEKHACVLLWVLLNLRFSTPPCVAPEGFAETEFRWNWGGSQSHSGFLHFLVRNWDITMVVIHGEPRSSPDDYVLLEDPPYVEEEEDSD
jgi:hypothetical protein